jgi:pyruvate/2-oxoglutarate dehydrogenase complex dihydrolipoamide dehydrogenase (E3) component
MVGSKVTIFDHSERFLKSGFEVEFTEVVQAECDNNNIELMLNSRIYSINESICGVTLVVELKEQTKVKVV